jgi:hypothetical protein
MNCQDLLATKAIPGLFKGLSPQENKHSFSAA